ncbi:hypothetical protein ABTL19_19265, partial [Acinetobacter baumannii]
PIPGALPIEEERAPIPTYTALATAPDHPPILSTFNTAFSFLSNVIVPAEVKSFLIIGTGENPSLTECFMVSHQLSLEPPVSSPTP